MFNWNTFITVLSGCLFFVLLFGSLYHQSKKDEKEKQKKKALELTEFFKESVLECVCFEETVFDKGVNKIVHNLEYQLLEKEAQFDSTKRIETMLEFSSPSSNYLEKGDKEAEKILQHMPYMLRITHTSKTKESYYAERKTDEFNRSEEHNKQYDIDYTSVYRDWLLDKDVSIYRFKDTYECDLNDGRKQQPETEFKYFLRVVFKNNSTTKYIPLFDYEEEHVEYGDKRAQKYLSLLNKEVIIENSDIPYDVFYNENHQNFTLLNFIKDYE